MRKALEKINTAILLVCFLIFSVPLNAQKEKSFGKNNIHGSVGTLGLFFSANVFYERILIDNTSSWEYKDQGQKFTKKSRFAPFVRMGYGGYANYDDEGSYALAQLGFLTGAGKHHFEGSIGGGYNIKGYFIISEYFPTGSLGYRYHSPGSHLFLRFGASVPELIYLGLGISI